MVLLILLPAFFLYLSYSILRAHRSSTPLPPSLSVLVDEGHQVVGGYFWQPLLTLRWLFTNVVLVMLREEPLLQIYSLLAMSVAAQIMIIVRMSSVGFHSWYTLGIEMSVSGYLYVQMALLQVQDKDQRELIGWTLAGIIVIVVSCNLVVLFGQVVIGLYKKVASRF